VIRVLERAGFDLTRQSGSHRIYRDINGKRVTVPYHSGTTLHPKVFKSILADAEMSVEQFLEMLGKVGM
jgi:predicted RNA binding protein YcfA (HicA-like mRNA interferase family)